MQLYGITENPVEILRIITKKNGCPEENRTAIFYQNKYKTSEGTIKKYPTDWY